MIILVANHIVIISINFLHVAISLNGFGIEESPVLHTNIHCTGFEDTISDCSINTYYMYAYSGCYYYSSQSITVASIRCYDGKYN